MLTERSQIHKVIGVLNRRKYSELVNLDRQAASVFALGTGHYLLLKCNYFFISPTRKSFWEASIGSAIISFFTVYKVFSYESYSLVGLDSHIVPLQEWKVIREKGDPRDGDRMP